MRSLLLWIASSVALAGINPSTLKVKIYAAYVSTSPYCTTLSEIFVSPEPELRDLFVYPILGSIDNSSGLLNGSYRCLVFKMSERLTFIPAANTLGCSAAAIYTSDLCTDGLVTTGVDGATTTCGASEDVVYLYLSTASTATTLATGVNPYAPPTASNALNGLNLSTPFTVSGAAQARFVVNASGSVSSTGPGNCTLAFPAISFVRE